MIINLGSFLNKVSGRQEERTTHSDGVRQRPTGSEGLQGRAVVLPNPLVSVLQQQADRRRSAVELVDLQSLDRLPVPACQSHSQLAEVSLASETEEC